MSRDPLWEDTKAILWAALIAAGILAVCTTGLFLLAWGLGQLVGGH